MLTYLAGAGLLRWLLKIEEAAAKLTASSL